MPIVRGLTEGRLLRARCGRRAQSEQLVSPSLLARQELPLIFKTLEKEERFVDGGLFLIGGRHARDLIEDEDEIGLELNIAGIGRGQAAP